MFKWMLLVACASSLALVGRDAHACGGCFHEVNPPPQERSVVTAHRMAFSVSPSETILWDQVQYSGNPREFAWVLPVHAGAVVELSHDEWFAALDASTQPVITAPPNPYLVGNSGCGPAACGSSASTGGSSSGYAGGGNVQVLSQGVVGPYETVTLQSSDPNALTAWLTSNNFDIPSSDAGIIGAYVAEKFDFIALRLRPTCGVQAMQPVRIRTPGADPTLPLRMVAAGVGADVDVLLWIVGAGRWEPQNFPSAVVDDRKVVWDYSQELSNYEALVESAMAQANGTTWVTEYAQSVGLIGTGSTANRANPSLSQAYYAFCNGTAPSNGSTVMRPQPCANALLAGEAGADSGAEAAVDAGADAEPDVQSTGDAAPGDDADASFDDGTIADAENEGAADAAGDVAGDDASADAGTGPSFDAAGSDPCATFDDLNAATGGLYIGDVWVTRLRAKLPVAALAQDLHLQATATQTAVSNLHQAAYGPQANANQSSGCESEPQRGEAVFDLGLLAAVTVTLAALRRQRRS
jgi:hypothetical protein